MKVEAYIMTPDGMSYVEPPDVSDVEDLPAAAELIFCEEGAGWSVEYIIECLEDEGEFHGTKAYFLMDYA